MNKITNKIILIKMILDPKKQYSRISNIIYLDGSIPLINLHEKFIDISIMNINVINYMNKYLQLYPKLFTIIQEEKKEKQLTINF